MEFSKTTLWGRYHWVRPGGAEQPVQGHPLVGGRNCPRKGWKRHLIQTLHLSEASDLYLWHYGLLRLYGVPEAWWQERSLDFQTCVPFLAHTPLGSLQVIILYCSFFPLWLKHSVVKRKTLKIYHKFCMPCLLFLKFLELQTLRVDLSLS